MNYFWHDMLEFLSECVLPVTAACVIFGAVIFGLMVGIDVLDCNGFERATGIPTRWEWGCYANVDGKWLPKKNIFGDAHEVRVK